MGARVFSLVVLALLAYLLWLIFRPFFAPILWALLLAFLLFPANQRLRGKLGGRRGLAALLLTLGVTLGIVLPASFLLVVFARQAGELLGRLSETAARYQIAVPQDIFKIPALDRAVGWIGEKTSISAQQIQKWFVDGARSALEFGVTHTRGVLLGALGAVLSVLLMLFVLYFFFRDGDDMTERLVRLVPADPTRKRHLLTHLSQVTRAIVYGSLLTSLSQGALVGVAFAVAGLPSPVVFGFLAAIASLLPVGGTALVWGPAAIVLAAQGRWGWAIFMGLWGALIVGLADNLLRPMLISGRAEISTLPVFFGVLGGIAAFGPIGMFLGPVVIALALALLRFAEESRETRSDSG